MINTTTEAMIAEIVDNALDQESVDRKLKVKIECMDPVGKIWRQLFMTMERDSSMKIIWTNHLNYQTDLNGGENAKIGKFNIGLKTNSFIKM